MCSTRDIDIGERHAESRWATPAYAAALAPALHGLASGVSISQHPIAPQTAMYLLGTELLGLRVSDLDLAVLERRPPFAGQVTTDLAANVAPPNDGSILGSKFVESMVLGRGLLALLDMLVQRILAQGSSP